MTFSDNIPPAKVPGLKPNWKELAAAWLVSNPGQRFTILEFNFLANLSSSRLFPSKNMKDAVATFLRRSRYECHRVAYKNEGLAYVWAYALSASAPEGFYFDYSKLKKHDPINLDDLI